MLSELVPFPFCEQIIVGFRNRGVGQLNVYTTSLYLFGNLVRIYTTLTQVTPRSPYGQRIAVVFLSCRWNSHCSGALMVGIEAVAL